MRLPIQIRRAECDALVCGDYRAVLFRFRKHDFRF